MPRYFFHIIDGNEYPDTEGTVLANSDAARAEAIIVSGEMLKDLGGEFWGNGEWQVRVEDEAGTRSALSPFRLTAPSTRAEPKRWNASFWRVSSCLGWLKGLASTPRLAGLG